jgi:hypothetical protein
VIDMREPGRKGPGVELEEGAGDDPALRVRDQIDIAPWMPARDPLQ